MKDINKNVTVNPETVATNNANTIKEVYLKAWIESTNWDRKFALVHYKWVKNEMKLKNSIPSMKPNFQKLYLAREHFEAQLRKGCLNNLETVARILFSYYFDDDLGDTCTYFNHRMQYVGDFDYENFEEILDDLCHLRFLSKTDIQGISFEEAIKLVTEKNVLECFDSFEDFLWKYSEEIVDEFMAYLDESIRETGSLEKVIEEIREEEGIDAGCLFEMFDKEKDYSKNPPRRYDELFGETYIHFLGNLEHRIENEERDLHIAQMDLQSAQLEYKDLRYRKKHNLAVA